MRYLLDSDVVRYALGGLYVSPHRRLSPQEAGALSFWRAATRRKAELFIDPASDQMLQSLSRYREVQLLLTSVKTLYPTGRYYTRWVRRLQQITDLNAEESGLIALATFGTDLTGTIFGMHQLITVNQSLLTGYTLSHAKLLNRLQAMVRRLSVPYCYATLPNVVILDPVQFK